ncbi:hypothetical protein EVG20_g4546 [Dentipellis fragilis]|uniref:Uncharacterized protein n=1 Tax=Dentipellis fragilis TaxID=205917 RepID=A0A4Y9YY08_9AGAM|nr:hypothetical protein EVG20_g4546 [Dentipellis fragilis]
MSSHSRIRLISETRAPPKEVFPEALGSNGLQPTTVLWTPGTIFHQRAHCCWQVDGRLKVFECRATHKSDNANHPLNDRTKHYWDVPSQSRNHSASSSLSSTSELSRSSTYPQHQHAYAQQSQQAAGHAQPNGRAHRSSHSYGHPPSQSQPTDYFAPSHPPAPGYPDVHDQPLPHPPRDRAHREPQQYYPQGYAQPQAAGTHHGQGHRSPTYANGHPLYDPRVLQSVQNQQAHGYPAGSQQPYLDAHPHAHVQPHYERRGRSTERYA